MNATARRFAGLLPAMALLLGACASLPEPQPHDAAPAIARLQDTTLARIAADSTPPAKRSLTGLRLLASGDQAFDARLALARHAERTLDAQYYLLADDAAGRRFLQSLHEAAQRGVRVRLLLDDMNAHGLDQQMLALDGHPNVEVRLYNPFRHRTGIRRVLETVVRAFRVNHRMHNKAWIADGRVAIVGGRNIGVEYFDASGGKNFRDLDLLLMGPAVSGAAAIFDLYWNSSAVVPVNALGRKDLQRLPLLVRDIQQQTAGQDAQTYLARVHASPGVETFLTQELRPFWSDRIEVVADPPQKWRDDDRRHWLVERLAGTLDATRTRALLISPYFVPGERGTDRLIGLVRKGAEVGVVTNSLAANDVPAVHSGYARYRKPLLSGGVKLYELRAQGHTETAGLFGSSGASLHTKAFVVDGRLGFVGSFNLDPRSVALNTEMGVLFDDAQLGTAVEDEYRRLAAPMLSYAVRLEPRGGLRWQDDATQPPEVLDREPGATAGRRMVARVLGWLPIESQL